MTDKRALNGMKIEDFAPISERFFASAQEKHSNHGAPLFTDEINDLTEKVSDAIGHHLGGRQEHAVALFKEAMKERSYLLSSPEIRANRDVHNYVKGVIAMADNGNPEESLTLTKDMYSNALDITYKGEAPPEPPEDDAPAIL